MIQKFAQRSACDRCRTQKLRCQEQPGEEPCIRCERAGALCTTSSARALGRPRRSQQGVFKSDKTVSLTNPRRSESSRDSATGSRRNTNDPSNVSTWAALDASLDLSRDASLDSVCTPQWMLTGNLIPSGDLQTSEDDLFIDPLSLSILHQGQTTAIGANFSRTVSNVSHDSNRENQVMDRDDVNYDYFECTTLERDREDESSKWSNMTAALIGLARLNESITQQLSRAKTYPGQKVPVQGACSDKHQETANRNGVAEALRSTTDLINILQTLATSPTLALCSPPALSHCIPLPPSSEFFETLRVVNGEVHGSSLKPQSTAHITTSLSTPAILLLLSSYIQLLQLHDILFRRVYELFLEMPKHLLGSCPGQAQSHFHIADLNSVDGHLHIKIIIQIIEHHLEILEKLIDLPAEYRLTGRSVPLRGVLTNVNVSNLVHIVMTQIEHEDCSEYSGQSLVVSLRNGIQKVKDLL